MGSMRVYPSAVQTFQSYRRDIPLACDLYDSHAPNTCAAVYWDTTNHCLVAVAPVRVRFTVNLLWDKPSDGWFLGSLIMKNQLGTAGGAPGGEYAGADLVVHQTTPPCNVSSPMVSALIDLVAGDRVWAVPCAIQAPPATLTNAMAGNGNVTVNYVEVEEIT